jgi:hypothetical protein
MWKRAMVADGPVPPQQPAQRAVIGEIERMSTLFGEFHDELIGSKGFAHGLRGRGQWRRGKAGRGER